MLKPIEAIVYGSEPYRNNFKNLSPKDGENLWSACMCVWTKQSVEVFRWSRQTGHKSGVMQQKASNWTHNLRFFGSMLANTSACMCVWETCPKRLEGQCDSQSACHYEQKHCWQINVHWCSTCKIFLRRSELLFFCWYVVLSFPGTDPSPAP